MLSQKIKIGIGLWLGLMALFPSRVIAASACTPKMTEIMPQMLAELPSYVNREIQRSRRLKREHDTYSYVIEAGVPDLEEILPLRQQQFTASVTDTSEQVFFSTLNKQYVDDGTITFVNHHWLFLTPTEQGWAIVHLFSSLNTGSTPDLAMPPRDARLSATGQAVKLWLRDYNARCAD